MGLRTYSELHYYASMEKCSFDSKNQESMVNSTSEVIDFDRVKTKYLNSLGKSEECAHSVDALGEDDQGHEYMIEFKNGEFTEGEIRRKIVESLLIYGDITHSSLKTIRGRMDFILVYNPKRKKLSAKDERAIYQAQLGKSSSSLYGLDKYEGFCFRRALLMSAEDFNKKMADKIGIL